MNGEGARQGAPETVTHLTQSDDTTEGGVPNRPRVSLVVEIEAAPRIVIDAVTDADRNALRAWVRTCRPDLDQFLRGIQRELNAKKAA